MATNHLLVQKCKSLRKQGFTLGQIIEATDLPKTTVFEFIRNIPLSLKRQEEIKESHIKRLKGVPSSRKGKCWKGREIIFPTDWSDDLLFLTAHLMFDGRIQYNSCIYSNRSISLISAVEKLVEKIFKLKAHHYFYKKTGVHRIVYCHVNLAQYFKKKAQWLKTYIRNANKEEKRLFLRVFFDDEGCASVSGNKRRVRGYQDDLSMLRLIQKLLRDFDIQARIEEKYNEIVMSDKKNIIKFCNQINFSKGVYINPNRKNSVWKQKLEKREILNRMIAAYQF